MEKYYTIKQVSELLNISTRTLYDNIKKGNLPATMLLGKWRVAESTINELIEKGKNDK